MPDVMAGVWEHFSTVVAVAVKRQQAASATLSDGSTVGASGSSLLASLVTEVTDSSRIFGREEVFAAIIIIA